MCELLRREKTVDDVMRLIKDGKVEFLDLKFVDLFGMLCHITLPAARCEEELFSEGIGFDGSSIRGFQEIHESDMLLKPEARTWQFDPFTDDPTLSFFCNVVDPAGRRIYSRDPRAVARRAETYLAGTGIADRAFLGPELEFFIFDDVRFDQATPYGFYHIDSGAGFWNRGSQTQGPNLGFKPARKQAYFAAPPADHFHNLRAKMVQVLQSVGIDVEVHHHEVGSGGQSEIGFRFGTLLEQADRSVLYKYVIKNVARRFGKVATFMPKPLFQENGSGMHVHVSLWKGDRNMFYRQGRYADLSEEAEQFVAGLLTHAPALCAFCAPTTNSYRRLVPGYEAPINLVYSARNRSACIRVPMFAGSPKSKRIEFRTPDPSCNPYLAFSAILMAGLDGIRRGLKPPAPIDEDIYELEGEQARRIRNTPGSLAESLRALEKDHAFLLEGGVFTPDLIETWIRMKRASEVDFVNLRPHPAEFMLYFDS